MQLLLCKLCCAPDRVLEAGGTHLSRMPRLLFDTTVAADWSTVFRCLAKIFREENFHLRMQLVLCKVHMPLAVSVAV
jgi:hypothetical protein